MHYSTTASFDKEFKKFPKNVRQAFYKQIGFLLHDIRHPSLRAKKYSETDDVWQARVNDNMRFYFQIEGGTYVLLNIKKHAD